MLILTCSIVAAMIWAEVSWTAGCQLLLDFRQGNAQQSGLNYPSQKRKQGWRMGPPAWQGRTPGKPQRRHRSCSRCGLEVENCGQVSVYRGWTAVGCKVLRGWQSTNDCRVASAQPGCQRRLAAACSVVAAAGGVIHFRVGAGLLWRLLLASPLCTGSKGARWQGT